MLGLKMTRPASGELIAAVLGVASTPGLCPQEIDGDASSILRAMSDSVHGQGSK